MKKQIWTAALTALLALKVCAPALAAIPSEDSKFMYSNYSKRVSMDFKDAALSEVLKIFSQQSGMNFIAASDVTNKRVTLFFENIPVEEALDKILTANGLSYETQPGSDIFVVKTQPNAEQNLVTRFYQLKYASVPSAKINSTISITSNGGESTTSGSSGGGSSSGGASGGTGSPAGGSTSGGSGIVSAVRAVLSQYGKLTEDPRTNTLIITDSEPQFAVIEDTIKRLDIEIPQIVIQVEMLDVSKSTSDLLGIKYSDTLFTLTGAQRSVFFPWDEHLLKNKGLISAGDLSYTAGSLNASTMTAIVQFLETQSDTKNLARPRLLTLNNETAQIKIATNEAIGLQTQTNSTGGTATQSIEAERVETGVFLLVTPQANIATGEITLAVAPKVIQARTGGTFGGQTFKDPEERGSQQLMKIKSGDTVIIGGLLRTDSTNTVSKLPILGDLPLVGRAFRHSDKAKTERELLIFITPSVVTDRNKDQLLAQKADSTMVTREQDVPKSRMKQINKELSSIEDQRF
jgi:type II secretory pathway component GspD/PulD (secretin)